MPAMLQERRAYVKLVFQEHTRRWIISRMSTRQAQSTASCAMLAPTPQSLLRYRRQVACCVRKGSTPRLPARQIILYAPDATSAPRRRGVSAIKTVKKSVLLGRQGFIPTALRALLESSKGLQRQLVRTAQHIRTASREQPRAGATLASKAAPRMELALCVCRANTRIFLEMHLVKGVAQESTRQPTERQHA